MEQLVAHWTDFDKTWYLTFFRKYVEKIQVSLKFNKNNGYFSYLCQYLANFCLKWEMFWTKAVEKIKTFYAQ
jgi:hypothetical protein